VTLDLHGYQTGSVSPESDDNESETEKSGNGEPVVEDVFASEYPTAE